jgi:hypothetical protein
MLPLLAAVALSCVIVSHVYAHLPYQEPSWPPPPPPKVASWLKTDKDQDQLAKGYLVPRVVPVEVYRRADYAQAQLKAKAQTQAKRRVAKKRKPYRAHIQHAEVWQRH